LEQEARKLEMRARLSANIRLWQQRCNMDIAALAKAANMAENTLYRLKRGDNAMTLDSLVAIADAFKIPPCMLLMPIEDV